MTSETKALAAAAAAQEKHAEAVVVLDLRALSDVTDFFLVCTAQSAPQLEAIRHEIEHALAKQGGVWHAEGMSSAPVRETGQPPPQWLLMDCGDVVVHLLDERARAFYRLEELWADAPRLSLPAASPAR